MTNEELQSTIPASMPLLRRHPELMSRGDTALLVVDIQEKLAPLVAHSATLLWNVHRLVRGAQLLGMHVLATEQYPSGLGATVSPIRELLPVGFSKLSFSCAAATGFLEQLAAKAVSKVLVVGIETHVCIQQTVFDLIAESYSVLVAADAVSSRFVSDHTTAIERMRSSGAAITSTEAALFEWCESAEAAEFKAISQIVRETAPHS